MQTIDQEDHKRVTPISTRDISSLVQCHSTCIERVLSRLRCKAGRRVALLKPIPGLQSEIGAQDQSIGRSQHNISVVYSTRKPLQNVNLSFGVLGDEDEVVGRGRRRDLGQTR